MEVKGTDIMMETRINNRHNVHAEEGADEDGDGGEEDWHDDDDDDDDDEGEEGEGDGDDGDIEDEQLTQCVDSMCKL